MSGSHIRALRTLFAPEREDAASIKKPFCGCGLFIHFVFYIILYNDCNYWCERFELELNGFRNLEAYL
jgi:hypothetical protein